MKRMLDKKLPKLIICWGVVIGMVIFTTPAYSRERQSSHGGDSHTSYGTNSHNSHGTGNHSSYGSNSHSSHGTNHHYSYKRNSYSSHNRNRSRSVRVVHKSDVIPAIIATGIVAGITFSMLDNNHAAAPPPAAYNYRPTVAAPVVATNSVTVTINLLNIRSGPGLNHPCIGQLHRGAMLSIMGNTSGWYYVTTSGGVSGWVMTQYTAPAAYPVGG